MKLIVSGALGAMGQTVIAAAEKESDIEIVAGFDKMGASESATIKIFRDPAECGIKADCIIDFSHFTAIPALMKYCADSKTPVVVATTALGEGELSLVHEAAAQIPVFRSANMSLGVNVISKMAGMAVPALEADFNIEIIEKHHNRKADSPSGTALMLAEEINKACSAKKNFIYGRHGKSDNCDMGDLGIHAVRGGTLPGQHTIMFMGNDEVIEITHTIYSRNVFAAGALKAARFIVGKGAGMYSMEDLLASGV